MQTYPLTGGNCTESINKEKTGKQALLKLRVQARYGDLGSAV